TLPESLSSAQVWVQPDGRVILLDTLAEPVPDQPPSALEVQGYSEPMDLLRAVATLTLEGHVRPAHAPPESIRTPAPEHAAAMMDRLVGVTKPYGCVDEFQADLAASSDLPTQITRSQRGTQLVVQTMFLLVGLWLILVIASGLSL